MGCGCRKEGQSIDEVDSEFVKGEAEHEGIGLWAKMRGLRASSTRTELAARVISLTIPKPMRMASDSRAVVNTFNRLLEAARSWRQVAGTEWWPRQGPLKKAWGLQPNGDLWRYAREAILQRGWDKAEATWVKGHANWKMVADGVTLERDKAGNDKADSCAQKMVQSHGKEAVVTMSWLAERQVQYTAFMKKVRIIIARVLTEEAALRKAREEMQKVVEGYTEHTHKKVTGKVRITPFKDMSYKKIQLPPINKQVHELRKYGVMAGQLRKFIEDTVWAMPKEQHAGDSWLELLAAFDRSGIRTEQFDAALVGCDQEGAAERLKRREAASKKMMENKKSARTG